MRRILDDLRELRWPQVFVELVLLVLGIVLALAVNNWMEDRRDASRERQYLELIIRDLDRDQRALAEFATFEEAQAKVGVAAYRALARGPAVPEDERESISQALSQLTATRPLWLTRVTYSDLTSTGNIRLIRSAALRDRIVSLYEDNDRTMTVVDRNLEIFVNGMYTMYLTDTALVAPRLGSNIPMLTAALKDLELEIGIPASIKDDRLWRLDPSAIEWDVLRGQVWRRTLVSFIDIRIAHAVSDHVASLRRDISDELARRWPNAKTGPPSGSASAPAAARP